MKFSDDEGSVVLEFIGFGILLQIPLLVFAIGLANLQHDQLAAEAITRDSMRSLLLIGKSPEETALELAQAYHEQYSRVKIDVNCADNDCAKPGNLIHLTTRIGLARADAWGAR